MAENCRGLNETFCEWQVQSEIRIRQHPCRSLPD
ncbi:unnamed protein product, partial [Allacma fusca]